MKTADNQRRFWLRWYDAGPENHPRAAHDAARSTSGTAARGGSTTCSLRSMAPEKKRGPKGPADFITAQECADTWDPFYERFPRTEWMEWPIVREVQELQVKWARR